MTPQEWIAERLDNCQLIAATKTGRDRDGWIEDAGYFSAALEAMSTNAELLAAAKLAVQEIRSPPTGGLRCGLVLDKLNAAIAKAEGRQP